MSKELGRSFNAEQRLIQSGITQEEISRIRNDTRLERTGHDDLRRRADCLSDSGSSHYSGDYQKKLQEELGLFSPPSISKTVDVPVTRNFLLWKTEKTKSKTETKEIQPVPNIAQEVVSYTKSVSEKGENPVTVVDFGSGAAMTSLRAAHLLKDDITEKKVRVIATNIDNVPTNDDIPVIESRFFSQHAIDYADAISQKTVEFVKADILELHEYLEGDPVHLLFMVDTFPFTQDYNDSLLKISGEILHPEYGTAVFGFGTLKQDPTYPALDRSLPILTIINNGLEALQQKGFEKKHPLQIAEGPITMDKPIEEFAFEVYQAKNAPSFSLYTEGKEIKKDYLGF